MFDFPLPEENDWLLLGLLGLAPIGALPVGASFLVVVGITKGLVRIGCETLRIFSILKEMGFEQRGRLAWRSPELLVSRIP